jgi:N utilization substance protein B
MATRHQARTAVVGLLYAYDLGIEAIAKFSDEILEESKIRNKQKEFSNSLFQGTLENLSKLDKEIELHLKDWDYGNIGKVEKAISRLGGFGICIIKHIYIINIICNLCTIIIFINYTKTYV